MNHKSLSSSASATPPPPPPPLFQTTFPPRSASGFSTHTNSTANRTPAIIPLDYSYQTMSPSTFSQFPSGRLSSAATTNTNAAYHLNTHSRLNSARPPTGSVSVDVELDNQYSSLFGDPVPPPPPLDFLTTQFNAMNVFHPVSLDISSGSEEDANLSLAVLNAERPTQTRLFSNVPFSSVFGRRTSETTTTPQRNFDVLPMPMPRLQPPDIQILPNSSGDSSSEARESPNYTLLAPDIAEGRSTVYEDREPSDVTEIVESYEVRDMKGVREYSEATRRVSNFSEDFKSNVGALSNIQVPLQTSDSPTTIAQQFSHPFPTESYTSNEWFRPAIQDYPEFSKIPRLRPSSKNIMSIKREDMPMHHSPVAAMINDSNGSSSGEERQTDGRQSVDQASVLPDVLQPPARPPDPSPTLLREIETDLMLSPREYLQQENDRSMSSLNVDNFTTPPPPAAPPPPDFLTPVTEESQSSIKRELSPVILRDLIATGGDFRVDQPRLHKKSSFTIISEKSPQSSRAHSPSSYSQKRSPAKSSVPKPVAKPRQYLQQKSLSATQLKLPQLPQHRLQSHGDDSPRPSVQFNMTGRHTPNMMTQRGILQHRESISSSQDVTPLSPSSALTAATKFRRPSTLPSFQKESDESKMKSCEALPFITDPYRTAIPRFNRSVTDLQREPAVFPPGALPRPLKPNPNPTRKQKGLLRILNGDSSHIPLRSNWASMDDVSLVRGLKKPSTISASLFQSRRRSSSTSPERRSSTQTASDRRSSNISSVTTSDFSFRHAPTATQLQRRKSLFPTASPQAKRRPSVIPPVSSTGGRTSRAKVAKPTTLSPIIGTPNKDGSSPQSPEQEVSGSLAPSETPSDMNSRRESFSKIPIRASTSRPESRSSSPLKEFVAQLPISDPTSRGTSSRTTSRATMRTDASLSVSHPNSRPASRSTSRASTHPISRAVSRASSRPNSRMEMAKEIANSRSNSRMSMRSVTSNAENVSTASGKRSTQPSPVSTRHRRNSISVSPTSNRRARGRRQSLSPPNKKRSGSRGRGRRTRERSESRRSSQSRIPLRSGSLTKVKRSSPKPKTAKRSSSRSPPKSKDSKATHRSSPVRSPKRKAEMQQKKIMSAKKVPTSVLKPESSVRRTPSSVSKPGISVKKQPNNLQKSKGVNIRRETSKLQKKDNGKAVAGQTVRPEGTAVTMATKRTGINTSTAAVALAASGLKRQATSKNLTKTATKNKMTAVKENTGKRKTEGVTTQGSGETTKDVKAIQGSEKPAERADSTGQLTSGSSTVIGASKIAAATSDNTKGAATMSSASTGSSAGSTTTIKRNPSNASLVRMASRMSLLSMKRSDSNLSRKATVPAVAEETSDDAKKNGMSGTEALQRSNSRAQLKTPEDAAAASILEKSQKTLENVQKTVTVATDEIHKTIKENLTDLKSLESDMARFSDSATSPTSSVATVVENKIGNKTGATVGVAGVATTGESISRTTTAEGQTPTASAAHLVSSQKSPLPPTQPIEADVSVLNAQHATVAAAAAAAATTGAMAMPHSAVVDATVERVSERAISVMPEVDCDDANFQNYTYNGDGAADKTADGAVGTMLNSEAHGLGKEASGRRQKDVNKCGDASVGVVGGTDDDIKRRSPDGQGGSAAGSGNGSREFLQAPEDDLVPPAGCCRCCTKFCLPCRRLRCSRCCRRKKSKAGGNESEEPVLSTTSSASTTNLEVINEAQHTAGAGASNRGCWQKLNCCKRCRKRPKIEEPRTKMTVAAKSETAAVGAPKQGKCGLCMSKLFCCRRVNKVDPTTGDETELKKCCFCIPCRRKKAGHGATIGSTVSPSGSVAWQDPENGIAASDASALEGANAPEMQRPQGCCKRFWSKLLCCRRKKVPKPSESRRASMKAPPPPSEDTRRKLHVDLVEYTSKMKGAIPVLPLSLAWFCAICNTVFPGLGTLFSGIFCLCVGIPRFSQYDSAKARFGSFIINIIVATAQLFCVLFCFVGWGWSIWWGTIMLKCARKLNKIKKVERLEMEEERRQAEAAAIAAATAARTAANAGVAITAAATVTTESAA